MIKSFVLWVLITLSVSLPSSAAEAPQKTDAPQKEEPKTLFSVITNTDILWQLNCLLDNKNWRSLRCIQKGVDPWFKSFLQNYKTSPFSEIRTKNNGEAAYALFRFFRYGYLGEPINSMLAIKFGEKARNREDPIPEIVTELPEYLFDLSQAEKDLTKKKLYLTKLVNYRAWDDFDVNQTIDEYTQIDVKQLKKTSDSYEKSYFTPLAEKVGDQKDKKEGIPALDTATAIMIRAELFPKQMTDTMDDYINTLVPWHKCHDDDPMFFTKVKLILLRHTEDSMKYVVDSVKIPPAKPEA